MTSLSGRHGVFKKALFVVSGLLCGVIGALRPLIDLSDYSSSPGPSYSPYQAFPDYSSTDIEQYVPSDSYMDESRYGMPMTSQYGSYPGQPNLGVGLVRRIPQPPPRPVRKPVGWAAPAQVSSWRPTVDYASAAYPVVVPQQRPMEAQPVAAPLDGFVGQQLSRNALSVFESTDVADNDFVNDEAVRNLLSNFGSEDVTTQVRLFLFMQHFFARSQGNKLLGAKFNAAASTLKARFVDCVIGQKWPTAENQADSGKPTVLGLPIDALFHAYVLDRRACHGLFNLWKSYTTASEMTPQFFDALVDVFGSYVLPGRMCCMAANALVSRIFADLHALHDQISKAGGDDVGLPYTLGDVEAFIQKTAPLQEHFSKLVTMQDVAVLSSSDANLRLSSIAQKLTNIEEKLGMRVAEIDRDFLLSKRLSLLSDVQEMLLRGGLASVGIAPLSKIIVRILNLHKSPLTLADQSYGAFFLATIDFLFFLESAVPRSDDFTALVPLSSQSVADVLKKQYAAWHTALLTMPQITPPFGMVKRTSMDLSKAAEVSAGSFLFFMPYVAPGMGVDLIGAKGIRIYPQQGAVEAFGNANWFDVPSAFDLKQFCLSVAKEIVATSPASGVDPAKSPSVVPQTAPLPSGTFDLAGLSLDDLARYSNDLESSALRWMSSLKWSLVSLDKTAKNILADSGFSIAMAWLRTMIVLDEVLFLSNKMPDLHDVLTKWTGILAGFEKIMGPLQQKQAAQRYISQVLQDLAQTHAYDRFSADMQEQVEDMFIRASGRSKSDPCFSPDLRLADAEALLKNRIKDGLQGNNHILKVGAVRTLAALFDPEQSILADDLFSDEAPGTKRLLVSVMMKAGIEYDRIEELVQMVPKSSVSDLDIQMLKAWAHFLEVFFASNSDKTPFYHEFASNKFSTGIKDLLARQKKILAALKSKGDISANAVIGMLPFKLRSSEDFKVKKDVLNVALGKALDESRYNKSGMAVKPKCIDLELRISGVCKTTTPIFLYDEGFLLRKEYSLGTYGGKNFGSAIVVLYGILNILKSVGESPLGLSVGAHLLAPINYIAKIYGDKLTKCRSNGDDISFLVQTFYVAVKCLKSKLPDLSSLLPETLEVWSNCSLPSMPATIEEALVSVDTQYKTLRSDLGGDTKITPLFHPAAAALAMNRAVQNVTLS